MKHYQPWWYLLIRRRKCGRASPLLPPPYLSRAPGGFPGEMAPVVQQYQSVVWWYHSSEWRFYNTLPWYGAAAPRCTTVRYPGHRPRSHIARHALPSNQAPDIGIVSLHFHTFFRLSQHNFYFWLILIVLMLVTKLGIPVPLSGVGECWFGGQEWLLRSS